MIVAGPTGSGKSFFITRLLKHIDSMIDTPIVEIIWCFTEYQSLYDSIQDPRVRFYQGIINSNELDPTSGAKLVILDDLMREADDRVVDLFTKGSHHRDVSVIFVTQNLFNQGKGRRDISLNAHYVVCLKNPRDRNQILHLSRQVCPQNPKHVQEAFEDACSAAHGYLMFDFKQTTPDIMRLRTGIFPDDPKSFVYVPKTSSIKQEYTVMI